MSCTNLSAVSVTGDYSENFAFEVIEGNFNDINDAKADAISRGGRLASLDTIEKIDATSFYLENILQEWSFMWIGLEYDTSQSKWIWSNGNDLVDERWYSGEPNNLNNGDYFTHYRPSAHGVWHTWNNTGQIDSHLDSYLLEIIPEPSTYALILGALVLGFVVLRK